MNPLGRWGKWLTTWATFKKRLPSLTWAATILLALATDANVIAVVPERWHFALRYLIAGATAALLYTKSVATGAHAADYERGLVPDRRGTGTRTGELPVPAAAPNAVARIEARITPADAGETDDAGERL